MARRSGRSGYPHLATQTPGRECPEEARQLSGHRSSRCYRRSQPYQVEDPDRHWLTVLNALVNRDKHRAVRTVAWSSLEFGIQESEVASQVRCKSGLR